MTTDSEREGWASYAAEQERHAETVRRLEEAEHQIDDHYDAARDRLRERDEALERLRLMTREAQMSREATEKAMRSHAETASAAREHYKARNLLAAKVDRLEVRLSRSVSWSEVIRALRAADVPEDSMATDDDLLRYEGRAEAVAIMRDMLGV